MEVKKAKEKFDNSPRKQVYEQAGVDISAEIIDDIIRNVIYDSVVDTDRTEIPTTSQASREQDDLQERLKAKTVDVEKLQARIRTQENVIEGQERNIREKEQELNELRVRNANDDVLNSKQQEINGLHEKLEEANEQYSDLMDKVLVSNTLLKEEMEKFEALKKEILEIEQNFEKFQKTAKSQKAMELNQIRQQYNEESRRDKNEAARTYWEGYKRINTEFKNIIRVGEAKQKEIEDR